MSKQQTVVVLNALIETSMDGQKGFLNAARHARAPHLRMLFSDYSNECARSATDLQACVRQLGGNAETVGTTAGALHRGWINTRTRAADDDLQLLDDCERGENHARAQYRHAMNGEHAASVVALLQRQYTGTLRQQDRIRELRNTARAAAW